MELQRLERIVRNLEHHITMLEQIGEEYPDELVINRSILRKMKSRRLKKLLLVEDN